MKRKDRPVRLKVQLALVAVLLLSMAASIGPAMAQAQQEVQITRVEPALFNYIVVIARRTRDWPSLSLGASPRAAISMMVVARAIAALDARDYIIPDDVKSAALPVLRHRLVLKPEADLEGLTADLIIADVLRAVEVPK